MTGSRDGFAKIWNMNTGQCLKTIENLRPVSAVAMDMSGAIDVIGSLQHIGTKHGTAQVFDSQYGVNSHFPLQSGVTSLSITPNGKCVLAGLESGDAEL